MRLLKEGLKTRRVAIFPPTGSKFDFHRGWSLTPNLVFTSGLFFLLLSVWAIATPIIHSLALTYPSLARFSDTSYSILGILCHQKPTRSLWVLGYTSGVCTRMFALFLSAGIFLTVLQRARPLAWIRGTSWVPLAIGANLPTLLDWGTQLIQLRESVNSLRLITGAMSGYGIAVAITGCLHFICHGCGPLNVPEEERAERMQRNPRSGGGE